MLPPEDAVDTSTHFDESDFTVPLGNPEPHSSGPGKPIRDPIVDPIRSPWIRWGIFTCVAVIGIAVIAFLAFRLIGTEAGDTATTPVSKNTIVGLGEKLPAFSGATLESKTGVATVFSNSDLLGKATLLLAWSKGDEGVEALLTRVARLAPSLENSTRTFQVITMNMDVSPDGVDEALQRAGAEDLLTLFDRLPNVPSAERVSARLRIMETPWIFLIDERGSLEDEEVTAAELTTLGNRIE